MFVHQCGQNINNNLTMLNSKTVLSCAWIPILLENASHTQKLKAQISKKNATITRTYILREQLIVNPVILFH